jgi:hypothetical protein
MNRIISMLLMLCVPSLAAAQVMACQTSPTKGPQLRTAVVGFASSPEYADLRTDIGLTTSLDTSAIAIVTVDSVCDAVTRGVGASSTATRTRALLVVKFGSFYAACTPTEGYMVDPVYILDDHFKLLTIVGGTG